jgi:primase-polymerase (primpol)-like protein
VAAHRAKPAPKFPVELEDADRWIRYSATKVPLTVDGRAASSTDPSTWSTFDVASGSTAGVGPGFVLNGDGIVCIDLDHCLVDGVLEPWAQAIVDMVPRTYMEVSPSGDGLHVWGRGSLERGRRIRVDGGFVEAYATGRYLTVTGVAWGRSVGTLASLDRVFRALGI